MTATTTICGKSAKMMFALPFALGHFYTEWPNKRDPPYWEDHACNGSRCRQGKCEHNATHPTTYCR